MAVSEEALLFGPERSHVGILTRPGEVKRSEFACVIPNSGLIYRVGPRRFSVKLARQLAEQGIPTLRFDLAGVGDSKFVGESSEPRERIIGSMRAALDELERCTGLRKFVVAGICSGATNGYHIAAADERVIGVFMYDGFWFRSRWTKPVYWAKRMRVLGVGGTLAALLRLLMRNKQSEAPVKADYANLDSANPPKQDFVRCMNELAGRGVQFAFVYGGTMLPYYSYSRQFADVFGKEPFHRAVKCVYLPAADHMLTTCESQRALQSAAVEWATTALSAS